MSDLVTIHEDWPPLDVTVTKSWDIPGPASVEDRERLGYPRLTDLTEDPA